MDSAPSNFLISTQVWNINQSDEIPFQRSIRHCSRVKTKSEIFNKRRSNFDTLISNIPPRNYYSSTKGLPDIYLHCLASSPSHPSFRFINIAAMKSSPTPISSSIRNFPKVFRFDINTSAETFVFRSNDFFFLPQLNYGWFDYVFNHLVTFKTGTNRFNAKETRVDIFVS